jgi:hypothetical protein
MNDNSRSRLAEIEGRSGIFVQWFRKCPEKFLNSILLQNLFGGKWTTKKAIKTPSPKIKIVYTPF